MRILKDKVRNHKNRILFFPVIFLILAAFIGADNRHLFNGARESVIYAYMDSFLEGEIGSGYGSPTAEPVSFAGLEPGDIVLGGYPNTAYGRFSHAGLYIGDNRVLEGYVDYGLNVQDVNTYRNYSRVCLLRVNANPEIKKRAVDYGLAYENEMFYPVAFKQGARYWNCTKIIWRAYMAQGIDLDEINDLWIAPESFTASRHVSTIYEKGT